MASRLRGLLGKQFCEWSVGKTFTILSACALLGLTIECQPARAQATASHPPVISTSSPWTLDAPVLASTTANGVSGNSFSMHANFSPDGTHLLFWSGSNNLVPGLGSGDEQLYMKDLTTGAVSLVSGDVNGAAGNGASSNPNNSSQILMFSPDGKKVVFQSIATNLVLSGTNGSRQIFVKDVTTGAVTLVSADVNGVQGNNDSQDFTFSADGTAVAFDSSATNFLPSPTHAGDIFVKNLATGAVTLVSADANRVEGNGVSSFPVFSPDGMQVAFVSTSTNLTASATNGSSEIYVKNLVSGAVTLVSADATGVPGNGTSLYPMFSPDGSKVAFNSIATNLAPGSASGNSEVYVKNLATGAITLVSTDASGAAANSNNSMLAVFSPDGTKIAFESAATNLVPGGSSGQQVFVKDLLTGAVTLASSDVGGNQGNSSSSDPNFSSDHKALAFQSMASNLAVTNGTFGIVVRPIFTSLGAVVDNPSATTLTTAGQLSFSDLDIGDAHTASVAAQAGNLGTLVPSVSKDTTGTGTGGVITWNYQVNETQVHALTAAATDTFTLTLTDSQGCTATTAIVVTDLPRDFTVVNTSTGSPSTSSSTSSCPTLAVTTSPSDLTVTAGQTASFTSAASGTPAPTVQWQVSTDAGATFNNVPGATSTTLTFTTSMSQNGNLYRAAFTNLAGTVTSTAATLTVIRAATTTALVSSQNPSMFGQAVTLKVTVSSSAGAPSGTVTFLDGATSIGTGTLDSSGRASLSVPSLAVGAHSFTASYAGAANFSSSSSAPLSQAVNKDGATVTLNFSANPSVFGQGVMFTAMVAAVAPGAGTATGTITFQDGANTLSTLNLVNGQASLTTSSLAVGSHSITAAYNGDSNFNAASSSAFSQTVNKDATSATLASSANPSVFGQAVAFTATFSAAAPGTGTPTGTVLFQDGSTSLGTANLLNGQASVTLSALGPGPHSVTAVYSGNANFNSSSSLLAQAVNKASTTTKLASSASASTLNQALTFTATINLAPPGTGTPSGTVTFVADGSNTLCAGVALQSNGTATCATSTLSAGSHTIMAAYSGDTNSLPSSNSLTVSVGASGGSADLAIKMRADDRHVSRGHWDTYIIRITNKGPSTAHSVVMTDVLPAGTVFHWAHASKGSCKVRAEGQSVTCTTASLSRSWEISIKVKITAPRGSTITNTAHVTSSTPDPNLSNNASSATISVSGDGDDEENGDDEDHSSNE
jgi:uncharacterized repeat protein (TIGR01451 family)